MATLSRFFVSRDALVNVKPDTLFRWYTRDFGCRGAGSPDDRPYRGISEP
jgi:hypothetical protein